MKDSAKITLVQLTSGGAIPAVDRMPAFFDEAAAFGSDLVAFPEYSLGEHVPIDHENVGRFRALAAKHRMYAVAGLVEEHAGGRWSTTAIVVDRAGNILGRYYKTHPASGPPPHWWPPMPGHDGEARGVLGDRFPVFRLDFAPIGVLQCYDGYFPEAWGCTSFAGAEIILWINGRPGWIEDAYCITASQCYGCIVGANISDGRNTGFAEPYPYDSTYTIAAEGQREESRLFPRIREKGDACVSATIDLARLRWIRKHLRTAHQRRPDLYGALVRDATIWKDYPDVPWIRQECAELVNRSQL